MMSAPALTRIVPWSQQLLAEILKPGDTAIDLTAGKGRDTLFLCRTVGPEGRVVGFDIQPRALEITAQRLRAAGAAVALYPPGRWVRNPPAGVHLIRDDHARLSRYVKLSVGAVIANLGYLPGGDQGVITRPDSTLAALQQALSLVRVGGRLAVVTYPGHPGGEAEEAAVGEYLRQLDPSAWEVLAIEAANRGQAPGLLVVQRRKKSNFSA